MGNWSADLLEYEALKELVGRYVASPLGQARLNALEPVENVDARLDDPLADLTEAMNYLREAGAPKSAAAGVAVRLRFSSLPDSTAATRKLQIEGAVLEALEILQLTQILEHAADVRSILVSVADRFPRLGAMGGRIADLRAVLRELSGKILPDGTVSDEASPFLARVRKDVEKQKRLIQESLERFLRVHRDEKVLQEQFVTIRNERFVVPVISGQQGRIDGVVHGTSGSGHTLFIEPLETIGLNNQLVALTEQELQEVHRILREMTRQLREQAEEVRLSAEILGDLDFLFGKAEFGRDFDCTVPRFSPPESRQLVLTKARHPLLEDVLRKQRRKVIPVTLGLSGRTRILLISGPNTGGKTVLMKTAGLLSLMAQSGLPVPCEEAEFPGFDQVLADIGDNQSIQESLSTFSAHIQRVRSIASAVTPDSLVLMDELGRATDPEEGGALGVAVMDHFRICGAFTLASTHLMALKVYGANTPAVLNAAMGFDEETLAPTYHLRIGQPGKSAGLDIARRLGMPNHIMERAQAALGTREQDISRFLSELQRRMDELTAAKSELEDQRRSLETRERELAQDYQKRENARIRDLEKRWEEMIRRFEEQGSQTLQSIQATVEQRKAHEMAARKLARVKRELREEFEIQVKRDDQTPAARKEAERPKLEEGARVRLRNLREPARVKKILPNGLLEVEAGFMRLKVGFDDVLDVLPPTADTAKPRHSGITVHQAPKEARNLREINLIGQRAEEAREALGSFLDDAAMAGMTQIRIVHGHGMGVLKRMVADLLSKSPFVDRFYDAPPHEGGSGATIAELSETG